LFTFFLEFPEKVCKDDDDDVVPWKVLLFAGMWDIELGNSSRVRSKLGGIGYFVVSSPFFATAGSIFFPTTYLPFFTKKSIEFASDLKKTTCRPAPSILKNFSFFCGTLHPNLPFHKLLIMLW
jgi:hypothetical protein